MTVAQMWERYGDEVASVPLGAGSLQQIVAHREGAAPGIKTAQLTVRRVRAEGGPTTQPPSRPCDPVECKRYVAAELAGDTPAPAPANDQPPVDSSPAPQTALICSDIHFPYQHDAAVLAFLARVAEVRPDWIIVAGDIVDAKSLGKFARAPDAPMISEEIEGAETFLASLRRASTSSKVRVVEGNHELRMKRYLMTDAAGLFGLACLDFRSLIGVKADEWVPYGKILRVGPLAVHHGRIVRKHSGYTARGELERIGTVSPVLMTGHTHRLGMHWRTDSEQTYLAVETGCLTDWTRHDYCPSRPNWQVGWIEATWTGDEVPQLRPVLVE